jgi:hypothetical protein
MPSVSTQGQTDSVYFDLSNVSNAFDVFRQNILLRKISNFGLSSSYVDWFQINLINRQSFVRISEILSFSYLVRSGVPQDSTLGPLFFNIFINDTGDSVCYSKYLLFADDLKIYRSIRNVDDCKLLQHDIDSMQNWYLFNGMKFNLGKTMTYLSLVKQIVFILITNYVTIWHHAPSIQKISVYYWTASFIFTSILTIYFHKV